MFRATVEASEIRNTIVSIWSLVLTDEHGCPIIPGFETLLSSRHRTTLDKLAAQINAGAEAMDAAAKERERGWQDAADCLEACEKRHGVFDSTTAIQIIREHSGLKRGDHESEVPR